MGKYYENAKANSDIIDSLGFLCHEAVGKITMTALEIKKKEDQKGNMVDDDSLRIGLFVKPPGEQTPLQPRHIQEAYRILQRRPNPLMNFRAGISRTDVVLI
jgi:transcription initiation protein SPT3